MLGFIFNKTKMMDKLHQMKLSILEIAKEVDLINEKLRVPSLKKKVKENEEVGTLEEKSSTPDGFDGVRQLRKDLNMDSS